jgi:hypothetical protein
MGKSQRRMKAKKAKKITKESAKLVKKVIGGAWQKSQGRGN